MNRGLHYRPWKYRLAYHFAGERRYGFPIVSSQRLSSVSSPADDHLERGIDLNEELPCNPTQTYLVRVKDDSMRDIGIREWDVLAIDHFVTLAGRHIVVTIVDGEFTAKRVQKSERKDPA